MPPLSPQDQQGVDAAAQGAASFVNTLNEVILFPLIALLAGVAFLVFLWGCAQYIMNADNPGAREDGVKHVTWGIVGLVIMMSAWAILSIVVATFGLDDELQDIRNTPTNSSNLNDSTRNTDGNGSADNGANGVFNPGNDAGGDLNPGNDDGGVLNIGE